MVGDEAYKDHPKDVEISMESSQHDITWCKLHMRLKYKLMNVLLYYVIWFMIVDWFKIFFMLILSFFYTFI